MSKIWFITGASKGFGREWAEAALERGDRVAATARDPKTLEELSGTYGDAVLPLQLDVTDRAADFAAVQHAAEQFGGLDVVVNNAGYGHFGMIEELTEEEARAQLEDEPVRRPLGHPGGAADHAGAGVRAHDPGLQHRRDQRLPDRRASTTPRSGGWRASRRRCRRRWPVSAST